MMEFRNMLLAPFVPERLRLGAIFLPLQQRTGGWGFAQITDGKADDEALHNTCVSCHEPAKDCDFVFARCAP